MITQPPQEKINKLLYNTTLTLLLIILPTAFLDEKLSRVIFYWCGYLSIAGISFSIVKRKLITVNTKLPIAYMIMFSIFFFWSTFSLLSNDSISQLLFTPAKRWFIAAAISLYILNNEVQAHPQRTSKIIITSMLIAFVLASTYGIFQSFQSNQRVVLGINRATLTAYAYSAFSLAIISLLCDHLKKIKYITLVCIILTSVYVIFITQTRSAMIIHPLLCGALLLTSLYNDKKLNVKTIIVALVALLSVISLNKEILINRFNSTIYEIQSYQSGNDYTSLGSRFSMWKLGIISFNDSPWGQSESHRNKVINDYLEKNKENSSAIEFINVHLHNEIVQYASLFGITGVLLLLSFYYMLIFKISTPKITGAIGISGISALLYGTTDVLFTSIEFIVVFSTTLTLSYFFINNFRE
ncbi:O-antigen ligase family protein [Plesiomonas shigelloides]|uniref:O-antigen ligase family protein n=1 Tax=Plesiomonas shigelloides TaxID=703 RepID=UPI001E28DB34|nr:O-antigen ligase family protein [Plesiomonas shigelloides]